MCSGNNYMVQDCNCVFTDGTCDCVMVIFYMVQNCSCVFTEGTCDSFMVIFIRYRTVDVCLLTVRVSVLW